jgi:geranylgeranyl diphosphate synthase type I
MTLSQAASFISNYFGVLSLIKNKKRDEILDLPAFQKKINAALLEYTTAKTEIFKSIVGQDMLSEAVNHAVSIINKGGKRVRPYLVYLAYKTEGGADDEKIIQAGIAMEIFHAFALIHDDVIDKGKERRGALTTHEYLKKIFETYPRGDKEHLAEGMAVLIGDLFFSWSNELIGKIQNEKARQLFFNMFEQTVAGQMIDASLMLRSEIRTEELVRKNELKTAQYSFAGPLMIGAALAGTDARQDMYKKFGLALGQAFQIQDDLLDVVGDPKKTGKLSFIDIEDGQHTLLTQYIFENGTDFDKEVLKALFGKPLDAHGRSALMHIFTSNHAVEYAQGEISRLIEESQTHIGQISMRADHREKWNRFITLIKTRIS